MQNYTRESHRSNATTYDISLDIKSGLYVFKAAGRNIKTRYFFCNMLLLFIAFAYFAISMLSLYLRDVLANAAVPSYLYSIAVISLIFLLITPLKAIYNAYLLRISGGDITFRKMMSFFAGKYFKILLLEAVLILLSALMLILSFSPLIAIYVIDLFGIALPIYASVPISAIGLALGSFSTFIGISSIFFARYYFILNPKAGVFNSMKASIDLMRGKRVVFLSLLLRCTLTLLGCVFILPALYAIPRASAAFAEFAFDVCG